MNWYAFKSMFYLSIFIIGNFIFYSGGYSNYEIMILSISFILGNLYLITDDILIKIESIK